jgi:hypothetical protein
MITKNFLSADEYGDELESFQLTLESTLENLAKARSSLGEANIAKAIGQLETVEKAIRLSSSYNTGIITALDWELDKELVVSGNDCECPEGWDTSSGYHDGDVCSK